MKLVTYVAGSQQPRVGMLENGNVIDAGFDGDMVAFIEAGDPTGKRTPVGDAKLLAQLRRHGGYGLIAIVGVQSNQFPRALDIAHPFRVAGIPVIIGGFHVSGTLALFHNPTPDIQEILDLGVTVVTGEVEAEWENLLRDVLLGELKPKRVARANSCC